MAGVRRAFAGFRGPPFLSLLPLLLLGCGDGIPDFTLEELAQATAQVRDAYHLQDYEFGAELGEMWVGWAPDAVELRAWTVANFALAGAGATAVKMAEEMAAAHPDSAWSAFALAGALTWTVNQERKEEALEASARAMEALPELADAVLLRGQALATFQSLDSALAFAATLPEELRNHPDVRVAMAEAMERQSGALDDATAERMLGMYEAVLRDHPEHIGANASLASLLRDHKDDHAGALDHLEVAAAKTPSPAIHRALWRAIFADPSLADGAKMESVDRDVRSMVDTAGDSPARWAALARSLNGLGMEELQRELEDRVLAEDPGGWGAEMVLGARWSALNFTFDHELKGDPEADPELTGRLRGALTDFMALETHRNPKRLIDAYWNLFHLEVDDPDVDPARLMELTAGWADDLEESSIRYPEDYYGFGALALARRPECVGEARRLMELAWVEMERLDSEAAEAAARAEEEGGAPGTSDDGIDHFQEGVEFTRAFLHTAMGRILAQEGSLDEAEDELARARELDPGNSMVDMILPLALHEAGLLLEKRADLARADGLDGEVQDHLRSAEECYEEGVRLGYSSYMGTPPTNPNETALEALYQRMHGNLEGFETHLAALKDAGSEERREKILAEEISDPEPLADLALETLDGEEVTSQSLLGSVVVINFWGTW